MSALESVVAESSEPTDEDVQKRKVVDDLIVAENKAIAEFARHLVTVSFTAIGVVISFKDKWLGATPASTTKGWLGLSLALFLGAGALGCAAAGIYAHRISRADFDDVYGELHRVARLRHRSVAVAVVLFLLAAAIVGALAVLT